MQGRKPKRQRVAMTLTLSPEGIKIVSEIAQRMAGNRSQAVDTIVNRYSVMLATAEPLPLVYSEFRLLAQMANGLTFEPEFLPKSQLLCTFSYGDDQFALTESAPGSPQLGAEERAGLVEELRQERAVIDNLHRKVSMLSELHCMVIVEAIEELYASESFEIEQRCSAVYKRIATHRRAKPSF